MRSEQTQSRRRPAVLLLPYAARSHGVWADGVRRFLNGVAWRFASLPARHFSWRMRGGALTYLDAAHASLWQPSPQLILSTSMLDLASLRACVRVDPACRWLLYFHENQFAYPAKTESIADLQLISIKAAAAADGIAFNSEYNRATWQQGARDLLARMPDGVPDALLDSIAARSRVLPVPLAPEAQGVGRAPATGVIRLVWNHRWETDKAPDRLLGALRGLRARGRDFELSLCGQQFRHRPAAIAAIEAEFGEVLRHIGFVEDEADYRQQLAWADVVVSTALHEFQGLAVLEATRAGCVPLVPDRLAYVELFPAQCRYASYPNDPEREAAALADKLAALAEAKQDGQLPIPPDVSHLDWRELRGAYRDWLGL